jgi:hypothetical protein
MIPERSVELMETLTKVGKEELYNPVRPKEELL